MHTTESEFSKFMIEYLGEIKTEFENILACLSGEWVWILKKMEVENLVTHFLHF